MQTKVLRLGAAPGSFKIPQQIFTRRAIRIAGYAVPQWIANRLRVELFRLAIDPPAKIPSKATCFGVDWNLYAWMSRKLV